ncbi:MAG TPA: DNA methyltransferase [Methanofastidiosum sp.]|nr:DNA methyltransferase [Methanofastidiosum sp.]HOR88463.1 DNA methyltransferase [Methanofastidiosum sp.]HPL00606.1 DNA methyltransferase [Methanofastidiosum sp.]
METKSNINITNNFGLKSSLHGLAVNDMSNKNYSRIYKIHKYWARKPWFPIHECILKYSNEGDLVVDLFLGSGVMGLESIALNRNFIGFDINPMATFISKNTIDYDFDEKEFIKELEVIKENIELLMNKIYSINAKCNICNNNLTMDHINIGPKYKNKEDGIFYCPNCGKNKSKKIISISPKFMNTEYNITKWVPDTYFPIKFYKDRFSYKGIKKVTDIYTNRNLYALSELFHTIKSSNLKYNNLFLLAFTNTLIHVSKLKSENVRPLSVNNYWIPDDYIEENVWTRFLERTNLIINSKKSLKEKLCNLKKIGNYKIINQSSFNTELPNESVDYIITDPPYGDVIQYYELSYVWNSWMSYDFNKEEEVIINPAQNKDKTDFINLLGLSIKEGSRILKTNCNFTLCFNNKEFHIWDQVLDIFKNNNFELLRVDIFDTLGNSYNNNWAKFSPKVDLYLTFKKLEYKDYTYEKSYSLKELLEKIIKEIPDGNESEIYDKLVSTLIWNLYHNRYKLNLSKITLKKVQSLIKEMKNGN